MLTFSKIVWILVTILCGVSIVWYLLGSTANFQRSLDLVGWYTIILVWLPSLILVVISITLLLRGWFPSNKISFVILWVLILFVIQLSVSLFEGVDTQGWLHDYSRSDPLKVTSNGQFEYRIEFINMDQKNRREQLYVRNISTGEEKYILVKVNTDELRGIAQGPDDNWAWVIMTPTNDPNQYELFTTENLRMPMQKFLIDIEAGTSRRLE